MKTYVRITNTLGNPNYSIGTIAEYVRETYDHKHVVKIAGTEWIVKTNQFQVIQNSILAK